MPLLRRRTTGMIASPSRKRGRNGNNNNTRKRNNNNLTNENVNDVYVVNTSTHNWRVPLGNVRNNLIPNGLKPVARKLNFGQPVARKLNFSGL